MRVSISSSMPLTIIARLEKESSVFQCGSLSPRLPLTIALNSLIDLDDAFPGTSVQGDTDRKAKEHIRNQAKCERPANDACHLRDAAGLAIVERTPPTGIARNVMLGASVADHQLASTTPAADKAGEQSVAVLRRSVMSACGQVVAHHLADRLRPLPADVPLMDAWDQRQPFGSRLTTAPGSDHACGCIISCRNTSLTIGVGAAVDRVLDHPVDGGIVRPAPDHVAIMALGGQVQPMLDEPEQGLPDTAEFGDLVEDEDDGLLDTAIGILLEPVADLHEADRGSDDEFAAPGLLIAGRQGTVAQKIELILVEAALQSQQQPVVALTRRIDRLLINQHGIDDAAHLDELLPVTAVAGETRDFPRRDRTDLAQADLGHHSIKAGARDAACRRAPEIVIDRFDARPRSRIAYCK